jgi:hypothetical protein
MIRKTILLLLLLGTFLMSSCATDSSSSGSQYNGPSFMDSQRDWCNMGAVYCGPGP